MESPQIFQNVNFTYKGKVIFSKLVFGGFSRMPKSFEGLEACYIFIENASFDMRTPDKLIRFETGDSMLAKCGNYYFENKNLNTENKNSVIGAYFHPEIIKELFDYTEFDTTLKSKFDVKIRDIKFEGVLSFVEILEQYLSSVIPGVQVNIYHDHLKLTYSFFVDKIGSPSFSFMNISINFVYFNI